METSTETKKGFVKYVFNFDEESKTDLMNLLQFALIGLVPLIVLTKAIDKYAPPVDDTKGTVEILAEIVIHTTVLFIGLFFICRIMLFFPTFSGADYPNILVITSVISILFGQLININSILTEKVNILTERLYDFWEGKTDTKKKSKKSDNSVKVSQPISQQSSSASSGQIIPPRATNFNDGTSINSLPNYDMSSQTQQAPNYNSMYRNDSTPLVNAASPGQINEGYTEPMAASDALGGGWGGFSSW